MCNGSLRRGVRAVPSVAVPAPCQLGLRAEILTDSHAAGAVGASNPGQDLGEEHGIRDTVGAPAPLGERVGEDEGLHAVRFASDGDAL